MIIALSCAPHTYAFSSYYINLHVLKINYEHNYLFLHIYSVVFTQTYKLENTVSHVYFLVCFYNNSCDSFHRLNVNLLNTWWNVVLSDKRNKHERNIKSNPTSSKFFIAINPSYWILKNTQLKVECYTLLAVYYHFKSKL